jgi:ion channel-forming bestrophin family protein
MRARRPWEARNKAQNKKYERYYSVPEKEHSLELELMEYLPSLRRPESEIVM